MNPRITAPGTNPGLAQGVEAPAAPRRPGFFKRFLWGLPGELPPHVETIDPRSVVGDRVWQAYVKRPDLERIGIACSGGGLRSASYNLGALQVLRERKVLAHKDSYLAAVSGGSYIASAHTITAGKSVDATVFSTSPPWAPGSPEEQHLRNNTTYLAPGSVGRLWMGLWMTVGFLRQFVPFLAGSAALGIVAGHVAYERWLTKDGTLDLPSLWVPMWVSLGLLIAAGLLVMIRQILERADNPPEKAFSLLEAWALRSLRMSALSAIVAILLPWLLVEAPGRGIAKNPLDLAQLGTLGGLVAAGKAVAALARRRELRRFLPLIASLAGLALLVGPALVAARWTIVSNTPRAEGTAFAASLAIVGLTWIFSDSVQPTMHMYYKARLATVFARIRTRDTTEPAYQRSEQPPWTESLRLSTLTRPDADDARMPELVVCAAVNLADSVVPPGRRGSTFTFERERSGSPLTGYVSTATLEDKAGPGVLTLPSMIAISGAAISPSMGKLSMAYLRLLMSLFNVRLGVWLPNPLRMADVQSAYGDDLTPIEPAATAQPPATALRPGPGYILKEAFGLTRLLDRYIYVTDGGHWENLGLVELLRRGCGQIICLDASGDPAGKFRTLGEAIALARTELRVEIQIDLSDLSAGPDGIAEKAWKTGAIVYPDGAKGVLVYVRCAATREMPVDAVGYRDRDYRFPHHTTGDQFFDDQQFESYRGLGRFHTGRALDELNLWRRERQKNTF